MEVEGRKEHTASWPRTSRVCKDSRASEMKPSLPMLTDRRQEGTGEEEDKRKKRQSCRESWW